MTFVQDVPPEKRFVFLVTELLIAEYGKTREQAEAMVKKHTGIMVNAMMSGRGNDYRACAMALEMAESAIEFKQAEDLIAAGGKFYEMDGKSCCDTATESWYLARQRLRQG